MKEYREIVRREGRRGGREDDEGREQRGQERLVLKSCSSSVSYSECENRAGVSRVGPFVVCELHSLYCIRIQRGW